MTKPVLALLLTILAAAFVCPAPAPAAEGPSIPTLALGAKAPEFDLPGVDGRRYTLASFAAAKVLVLVFTADHCPTAQAYEGRIEKL
ncbi:MAG TPA: redoxin domain-containing protein, partial [Vicinamibacteria bacterium]|nr:redoxin domain-containing protein [Vicinamibacteria bacterium]